MEFFQAPDGSRSPLPKQNVDTGMGLERLTASMQGVSSIYDTDLYQTIISRAGELAGVTYGAEADSDVALRVIADHARSATFLISDGVLPGNEGRSYVLRRILRRAIRYGRGLGLTQPFMAEMARVVIGQFGEDYPALVERQRQIEKVLTHEEETFGRTLSTGIHRFQDEVAKLRAAAPADTEVMQLTVPGAVAFRLYDTYGFPLDLTVDLAREQGMAVDIEGFDAAMAEQRVISRGGTAFKDNQRERNALYAERGVMTSEFLGYESTEADATILALLDPNGFVDTAEAGDEVEIVLDRTPFYGESGGQIGDKGEIRSDTGVVSIDDTFKPTSALFVHRGIVAEGFIKTGEKAQATVDSERRQSIKRNHTATHLLHQALREVLGTDTHQAGSLVAPDRLRFDFTSIDAMTPEQVARVGAIVSEQILASTPVSTRVLPYADAVEGGAMALFGEKYGDEVRVVTIGDFSKELCGGTHLDHTGQIGPFAIVTEGSVAAGVRRIEAVTGQAAIERGMRQQAVLDALARDFRAPWTELTDQVASLREKLRASEREAGKLRAELAGSSVGDLVEQKVDVAGIAVVAGQLSVADKGDLRTAGDRLRDKLGSGIVVLGAEIDGKPSLIALVTPDVVAKGVKAGDLVRESAVHIDGKGGGRPDLAEAGGKDASGLGKALAGVPELVRSLVSKS